MGLDMYLTKSKRVKTITVEQYSEIDNAIPYTTEEYDVQLGLKHLCPQIEGVEQLNSSVRPRGKYATYLSIKEELGYWRKSNQIHNWFVENCQEGIDECQLSEVSREDLEELLELCYKVVNKKSSPEETLPPTGGFFFGSTDVSHPYYMEDIKSTISILEKAIAKTDWEKEIVFYRASW